MEIENNPLIQPEDYFKGYNDSIKELRNRPDIIELDRLFYEVFEHNEQGKKLLELVIQRFFVSSQISKGSATYQIDTIWQEGFRDAWRLAITSVMSHRQRIKAEASKHVGTANS
jgi:hypothetical protein